MIQALAVLWAVISGKLIVSYIADLYPSKRELRIAAKKSRLLRMAYRLSTLRFSVEWQEP